MLRTRSKPQPYLDQTYSHKQCVKIILIEPGDLCVCVCVWDTIRNCFAFFFPFMCQVHISATSVHTKLARLCERTLATFFPPRERRPCARGSVQFVSRAQTEREAKFNRAPRRKRRVNREEIARNVGGGGGGVVRSWGRRLGQVVKTIEAVWDALRSDGPGDVPTATATVSCDATLPPPFGGRDEVAIHPAAPPGHASGRGRGRRSSRFATRCTYGLGLRRSSTDGPRLWSTSEKE